MNGIHDMGGMDGFGSVPREKNEPVFHAGWEKQVFAIVRAMLRGHHFNMDEFRYALERISPPRYLASSYYERWLDAIQILAIEKALVSRAELGARGGEPPTPAIDSGANRGQAPKTRRRERARFRPGDRVIARNINSQGHTRLPRYARGKRGLIRRDWGIYVFPDSNALVAGKNHQHVYSVSFRARELWGKGADARDEIRIDLWEDYLEGDPTAAPRGAEKSATGRIRIGADIKQEVVSSDKIASHAKRRARRRKTALGGEPRGSR